MMIGPLSRFRSAAFAGLMLVVLAASTVRGADAPPAFPAGTPAPPFETIDTAGTPFVLKEALSQGPIMLVFWSIFCGSCREELQILQQIMPAIEARKVQLVAVNLDEPSRNKTVKGFAAQQGFSFKVVYANTEEKRLAIDELYQVRATPTVFFLSSAGKIAASHVGPLTSEEIDAILATLN